MCVYNHPEVDSIWAIYGRHHVSFKDHVESIPGWLYVDLKPICICKDTTCLSYLDLQSTHSSGPWTLNSGIKATVLIGCSVAYVLLFGPLGFLSYYHQAQKTHIVTEQPSSATFEVQELASLRSSKAQRPEAHAPKTNQGPSLIQGVWALTMGRHLLKRDLDHGPLF